MGTMIEFARPDGGETKGYLATAGQGRPGVVVIQEWWGLNDQICGVADRFARAGYNALARPCCTDQLGWGLGPGSLGACPSNIRKDAILKFYCPICGCRDGIFPQRGFE